MKLPRDTTTLVPRGSAQYLAEGQHLGICQILRSSRHPTVGNTAITLSSEDMEVGPVSARTKRIITSKPEFGHQFLTRTH
jgi:hypothetical protein